jgi:hypothetical protein
MLTTSLNGVVDGRPKALWPLHPDATYVWVDYVSGEVYYETTLPSGEFLKLITF